MALLSIGRGLLLAFALALAGCATPLGKPVASLENVGKARAASLPPLSLGKFALGADKSPSLDQGISIRTHAIRSPYGDSFAAYLKEVIAEELRAGGLLDASSPVVIEAELTDSRIWVPVGAANAAVAARFVVSKSGRSVFDKELRAESRWDAPFNGFEAVPMAVNHYEQLYRQLTGKLFDDPDFRAAVQH